MSIKIYESKLQPSLQASFFKLLQRANPDKIALNYFTLREYTLELIKKVWELSASSKPIWKQGYKIKTINKDEYNCQWIYKEASDKKLTVFYIHGGAYLGGSLSDSRRNALRYAINTGCALFSVDYRISAAGAFPCALEDALDAYKEMLRTLPKKSRVIIIGDSAGGGLALSLTKKLIEEGIKLPRKLILNSPWTDLSCSAASYITNRFNDTRLTERFLKECARVYAGEHSMLKNQYVSPLYCDFTGFPPIHIHVGTSELLLSDSINVAFKASNAGVNVKLKIWNGMFHMFHYYEGLIPESTKVCEYIYRDIMS